MTRPAGDLRRELEKVQTAVSWVVRSLDHEAQHNAAMHMNDRVLYPPATAALMQAELDLERLIEELRVSE